MKKTQLAEKELRIIAGSAKCWMEAEFIKEIILLPEPRIYWNSGIELNRVMEFCDRVHKRGGKVLGIRTSYDSPYLNICLPFEHYNPVYDPDWVISAMDTLQKNNIEKFIIPTCDFDWSVLHTINKK